MSPTFAAERLAELRPRLAAFLAESAGAKHARLDAITPITEGAIQENWLTEITFDGGAFDGLQVLVLRSDAPTGVAASHSRAREFALLRAAWDADVTVPEPLWLCEDEAVIGKPFFVMRRVEGVARGYEVVKDTGLGGDRAALAGRLGEELAKIHRIMPPRAELDFLELPEPDPARHAVTLYRKYLDAMGEPCPGLEWGLRWCELHAPPPGEITLVHQDFRSGNYMVDARGLVAVLDWEFCAWGDPMSDLGWFCAKCWRYSRPDLEAGGIAPREPFYRAYEQASGRKVDPDAVAFWEVMAHLRWAVVARQQGARTLAGGQPSLDLALTGRIYPPELEYEALKMTPPARWRAA
ncbi:MAG: phosphotransferase family protein [Kiloniellales bacterium]